MRKGTVILLNGPSSSGKSTLANALRTQIQDKTGADYGVVSIDDFLKMTADQAIYEDDVFDISVEMCEHSIEMLRSKQGVIIDHVITSERIFRQLMDCLKAYDVRLVHVTCPIHVLREREENRKNRCLGSAEASHQYLFPKEGYDLTVDTFAFSAGECALQMINALLKNKAF